MERIENIQQLVKTLPQMESEQWIFTNVNKWNSTPEDCVFYYLPWDYMQTLDDDEVCENDDGAEIPVQLKDENLKEWMLVGSLKQIARSVNQKNVELNDFVQRINHYREFDTFKD
jgi:hypothetical protein